MRHFKMIEQRLGAILSTPSYPNSPCTRSSGSLHGSAERAIASIFARLSVQQKT